MLREDRIRIQHMLDAINEALTFTKGHQKDDLSQNRMLMLSLIKEIEIIGEAASKVTEKTKTRYPQDSLEGNDKYEEPADSCLF
jgi:uncharacterized protein with HEPN domain